jgi:predicted extracellular nuclease
MSKNFYKLADADFFQDRTNTDLITTANDWSGVDGSADNAVQPVPVQYRIGDAGAWSTIAATPDASTGPSQATLVTHLDVALPAAADNQSQVEVRALTADAVGSDEWIGVDNIRVTSHAMPTDLRLNFTELVKPGSGAVTISDGAGDVRTIDVNDANQVHVAGQSLVIDPAFDLRPGATYHVSVDAGAVLDLAGNAWGGTGANPLDLRTVTELTRIYEIQGAGHRSAYDGQVVNTTGVVTAIDTTGSKGFYI